MNDITKNRTIRRRDSKITLSALRLRGIKGNMFVGDVNLSGEDIHLVGDALILGENREMFFLMRKENKGSYHEYYIMSDRNEYAFTHAFYNRPYTFFNTGRNYVL